MSEIVPIKPRFASPCNHCGICCQVELCHIAELAFPNSKAPCPALLTEKDGSLCGLVLTEEKSGLPPMIRKSLGIGAGCSMPDDDTTRQQVEEFDRLATELMFGDKK